MRVLRERVARLGQMFDSDTLGGGGGRVQLYVWLPLIDIRWCTATARHHVIHSVRAVSVVVILHPVVEQVIVPSDRHPYVVTPEEREVQPAYCGRLRFNDRWPSVRAR